MGVGLGHSFLRHVQRTRLLVHLLNGANEDPLADYLASLRRLRLMRGLSRDDFPGVAAKTIARIERGEVERPREETLHRIAQRLGVAPADITTY